MNRLQIHRLLLLITICLGAISAQADTTYVHQIAVDVVPSVVNQTNSYLRGSNPNGEKIDRATILRLKYAIQQSGNPDDIGSYCGIGGGVVLTNELLGRPFMAYILQGAPIINFSRNFSLNYELQLGAAFGWHAYEAKVNEGNHVVGSRVTAYIGADVFFRYAIGRYWDLNLGYGYTHFSNANLRMPNEGLNIMGCRASVAFYFNRDKQISRASILTAPTLPKDKRWATDIVAFGGWKKRSLENPNTYNVAGLSVSPTYRLNSAFALGPELDVVYDNSVNPQVSVGLQARAELTMPFLRASGGIGHHVVGGMNSFYETLAMKIDVLPHFFLNIGYILYNYNYTNNLMLGIGCRI